MKEHETHCKQILGKLYCRHIAKNFRILVFPNIVSRTLYNFPRFVNFCSRNRAVVQKRPYLKTFTIHFSTKRSILSENSTIRMSQAIAVTIFSQIGSIYFYWPERSGRSNRWCSARFYLPGLFLARIISRTSLPCP